eukprot:4867761-Amphidinium_carterae.1
MEKQISSKSVACASASKSTMTSGKHSLSQRHPTIAWCAHVMEINSQLPSAWPYRHLCVSGGDP